MGMWCGTHARFIREKTSGQAKARGLAHADAEHASANGLWAKGAEKDPFKSQGKGSQIHEDNEQRTKNINEGHDGNDRL